LRRGRGADTAILDQRIDACFRDIETCNPMSCLEKIAGHRQTHIAKTNKSNTRHAALPG
jgi:hypothetical protein